MKLSLHLVFHGNCEEAFAFYAATLAGRIDTMVAYGETPLAETVPINWRDKIVHATLTVGDVVLLGADVLPPLAERAQGYFALLVLDTVTEAERVFAALAADGSVTMPLQRTFWAPSFGVLVDRFGTPWEITCETT